jgi:hypothetical protein
LTLNGDKQGWFDRPANVRLLIRLLVAVCVVLVGLEFVIDKHGHFGFEEIPGFHAVFGFLAFTAAVYAGKLLRALLGRDEDYYDR